MKRRKFSTQKKSEIIRTFNALPRSGGERMEFRRKNGISWTMMNGWKRDPDVKQLLNWADNDSHPEKLKPTKSEMTAKELIDVLEIKYEGLGELIKEMKTHVK